MSIETQASYNLGAPVFTHPSRVLFESGVSKNNIAFEYIARLDPFIEDLRQKAPLSSNLMGQLRQSQEELRKVVVAAEQDPSVSSNHIYRLLTSAETLEEMVCAPGVLTRQNSSTEDCDDAVQHLGGVHVKILEGLLANDSPTLTEEDREYRTGIVNEQTFLAAMNATRFNGMAAIQSLGYEDFRLGVDSVVYMRDDKTYSEIPIQVKTINHGHSERRGVLYVYMNEFNREFRLSQGLIYYMNHGTLTANTEQSLSSLIEYVREGSRSFPRQPLL